MMVQDILRMKASNDVATTTADQTIAEAAKILHRWRIGALVVVDDSQHAAGIISERDIVRGIATEGERVLGYKVSDLMTRLLHVCHPEDEVETLAQKMTTNRVRHLPVIADGRLAGIVTIGDVVKARLEHVTTEVEQMREYVAAPH